MGRWLDLMVARRPVAAPVAAAGRAVSGCGRRIEPPGPLYFPAVSTVGRSAAPSPALRRTAWLSEWPRACPGADHSWAWLVPNRLRDSGLATAVGIGA
jgi:hypothetical protein